jgi:NAD(P)-dependent dehydrogenase (short-subunit alcohol dehydrogenase family)
VTDAASIASAVQAVAAKADGLELHINNAGIYPGGISAQRPESTLFDSLEGAAMLEVFRGHRELAHR